MALKIVQSNLLEKRTLTLSNNRIVCSNGLFSTQRVRFEDIDYILFSDTNELTIGYGKNKQITIQTSPKKRKHQLLIDELLQRLQATGTAARPASDV